MYPISAQIHDTRSPSGAFMCKLPPTHRATSSMDDREESEDEQGGPSWQAHRSAGASHLEERGRSTDEGGHGAYEIPLLTRAFEWPSPEGDEPAPRLQPRFTPDPVPPLTPGIDPPRGTGSAASHYGTRLLRPPPHEDSQYGRHRSAPLYGSDDWDRRMSFGRLPPPGTQREASSSRVVLPPVSHLLEELGMLDEYERGPVLPRLRLPDGAGMGGAPKMGEERRGESEGREKRGRVDMGEEKRPGVRKIYVACDFCRGRKLRCDGGRPRCSNCETRSLSCRYQDHPRRRGPGKAPKGSRAKKERRRKEDAGPSGMP